MATKVEISFGAALLLWIGLTGWATAGWDKPFDEGGPLSINKPLDQGGGLSINKPLDQGGGLSINKPFDQGGGLSINKPLDQGGGLSINKPLDQGGGLSINKPFDQGGGLSINKPFDQGGGLSIGRVKFLNDIGKALEKAAHDTGDFIGQVGTTIWKIITFRWASDLFHKAQEKAQELLASLLGLAKYAAIWLVVGFTTLEPISKFPIAVDPL